jgi:hypothetical protein
VERLGIPSIMVSDGPHGLRAQLRRGDHFGRLLQDPELIKGTMPMHTLAAFEGMALSHDELEQLVAEL